MTEFKIILVGAIAIAGVTASLVIQHLAQVKLRENDVVLRQQNSQLAELAAEHQRLSNRVAQAKSSPVDEQTAELVKLRTEAEALRKQTNPLAKQLAENRRPWPSRPASMPDSSTGSNGSSSVASHVVSDSNSEEYKVQLYRMASAAPHALPLTNSRTMKDARSLRSAVGKYAREHQGEFPSTFDQAAPYYDKDEESPRTSEFEMVYQGSLNELTNVPLEAAALIRERQAWLTPSGKWARVYAMVGGSVLVVESDDNFQSWEAEHIIPPPAAGQ